MKIEITLSPIDSLVESFHAERWEQVIFEATPITILGERRTLYMVTIAGIVAYYGLWKPKLSIALDE